MHNWDFAIIKIIHIQVFQNYENEIFDTNLPINYKNSK